MPNRLTIAYLMIAALLFGATALWYWLHRSRLSALAHRRNPRTYIDLHQPVQGLDSPEA